MAIPTVASPDDPKINEKLAARAEDRMERFAQQMHQLAPGEFAKLKRDAIRDPRVTVDDLKRDFTESAQTGLNRELAVAAANARPKSRLAWEGIDADE
jgi:hypothetical protein